MDLSGVFFEAQLVVPWRVRRPRCTRSREIWPGPSLHRASIDALIRANPDNNLQRMRAQDCAVWVARC